MGFGGGGSGGVIGGTGGGVAGGSGADEGGVTGGLGLSKIDPYRSQPTCGPYMASTAAQVHFIIVSVFGFVSAAAILSLEEGS